MGGPGSGRRKRVPAATCFEHPGSHVVRNGTYGSKTPKRRQRYRCYYDPEDKTRRHSFTPLLPRDHVCEGEEHCAHCEELRGVHRGETAVARRHSWPTRVVVRGLEQLAAGGSYADVGRWARRVTDTMRTRTGLDDVVGAAVTGRSTEACGDAAPAQDVEAAAGGKKRRKGQRRVEEVTERLARRSGLG